jgi:hydroxylamine dehydrogenase
MRLLFNQKPLGILISVVLTLMICFSGCGQNSTVTMTGTVTSTVTVTKLAAASTPLPVPAKLASDACYVCHKAQTPGITGAFSQSMMAQKGGVVCSDCHVTKADYPGTDAHYATYRLAAPTPTMCQKCHATEVSQFSQGRHSLPAYAAVHGVNGLSQVQIDAYKAILEGGFDAAKQTNALAKIEGDTIVPFACDTCHQIGQPHADNSAGRCQSCHVTHQFSLEQARKPDTCGACHIGPDHPQTEIYMESAHGVAYQTLGASWNWNADQGKVTASDIPVATCATCHISAFGGVVGSHDVGERLSMYSAYNISTARPNATQNKARMQSVCKSCHGPNKIAQRFDDVDKLVATVNDLVKQSDAVVANLKSKGLLTDAAFDEPIDFTYYELWHHWGRTTKFGAEMNGADYAHWHGIYELNKALVELKTMAQEKQAGK